MGSRRIEHLGEEWDVDPVGVGFGVGTGAVPDPSEWAVDFRCVSDPSQKTLKGHISVADPAQLDEDELKRALGRAVLLDLLEGKDWITAEEIQRWVGLPTAEIKSILSGMGHKVIQREDMGSKPHFRLHSYDDV